MFSPDANTAEATGTSRDGATICESDGVSSAVDV
jgi:hypothetical protein